MLKQILSYGAVEAFSKGLNRAVILILPLILSPDLYGKVGIIVAAELILPFIALLGFDRALIRFYHEREKFNGLSNTIFTSISFFQIFLLLCYGLAFFLGRREMFGLELYPDVLLLLFNVYLLNLNQIFLNIQRVQENHMLYFRSRMGFQIIKFIFVIGLSLIWRNEFGYLLGVFVSISAITMVQLPLYRKEFSFSLNTKTLGFLIMFCWPFIFHTIAANMLGNMDRFILERYVSLSDIGIYTLAFSLGSSISFAFQGISVYLEPLIYKSKTLHEQKNRLDYYLVYTLFGGGCLAVLVLLGASLIIPKYFEAEYWAALKYLPIIILGNLFMPFYYQANYRLVANQKPVSVAKISVLSGCFNVLLNLLVIPLHGALAATVVTWLSLFVLSFLLLFESFNWKWRSECSIVLILFLVSGCAILIDNQVLYLALPLGLIGLTSHRMIVNRKVNSV